MRKNSHRNSSLQKRRNWIFIQSIDYRVLNSKKKKVSEKAKTEEHIFFQYISVKYGFTNIFYNGNLIEKIIAVSRKLFLAQERAFLY